ncbi:MAG: hypothetical protein AAF125_17440, partial [Chloroflexota bacterium]
LGSILQHVGHRLTGVWLVGTDDAEGLTFNPTNTDPNVVEMTLRDKNIDFVTYADWLRIDEIETARGAEAGRPRVKFTEPQEMLALLRENVK